MSNYVNNAVVTFQNLEPVQFCQVLTIILGIIDLGLTLDSYLTWPDEIFFLSAIIVVLVLSTVCLVGSKIYVTETTKVIDMLIYLGGATVLLISSTVMLVSTLRFTTAVSGFRVAERILSSVFGFGNGLCAGFIGVCYLKELQNSIYPITLSNKKFIMDWGRLKTGSGIVGKLQVVLIFVGAIDLGLTAYSYVRFSEEALFLAVVTICFVFSLVEFLGSLFGLIKNEEDSSSFMTLCVLHIVSGILLISGGILMIISVVNRNNDVPTKCGAYCNYATYDARLTAGGFGIINGILYQSVAYCWYLKARQLVQTAGLGLDWDYEDLGALDTESPETIKSRVAHRGSTITVTSTDDEDRLYP